MRSWLSICSIITYKHNIEYLVFLRFFGKVDTTLPGHETTRLVSFYVCNSIMLILVITYHNSFFHFSISRCYYSKVTLKGYDSNYFLKSVITGHYFAYCHLNSMELCFDVTLFYEFPSFGNYLTLFFLLFVIFPMLTQLKICNLNSMYFEGHNVAFYLLFFNFPMLF